jgi:predicted dehydrogenase
MTVGVLVVGADVRGRGFGARAHVPAVEAVESLRLAGVCTARQLTADAAAAKWQTTGYADYRAALTDPEVALVTVAVRVALHREIVEAAIAAGRSVYCEWPLATGSREASELAAAAAAAGVATAIGTQGRFAPAVVAAREAVAAGEIGRVLSFQVEHQLARFPVDSDRWWLARDDHGSGALHVATAHATDTLEALLSPIAQIAGLEETRWPQDAYADTGESFEWTAADTVAYVARLADGTVGSALISNTADPPVGFSIRLLGEEGVLVLKAGGYASYAPAQVAIGRRGAATLSPLAIPEPALSLPPASPARNVALALSAFAAEGTAFRPNFEDAVRLHRVLEAIARSSREAVWVDV